MKNSVRFSNRYFTRLLIVGLTNASMACSAKKVTFSASSKATDTNAATTSSSNTNAGTLSLKLAGLPDHISNATVLNLSASGDGIATYAALLQKNNTTCPDPSSESDAFKERKDIAEHFVLPLTKDGIYTLCVVGFNEKNTAYGMQTYSWEKDSVPPAITLQGTPDDSWASSTLDVTVTGDEATQYKFAVADGARCDGASYSDWVERSQKISSVINGDGQKTLCVIPKDAAGNEATTPVAHSWVQQTAAPIATLSGAPTGSSSAVTLNITVGGTDVEKYKYAIVSGSATCATANYSAEISVTVSIVDSISSLTDGTVTVCALGINKYGKTQSASDATSVSWTKDTGTPNAQLSNLPTAETNVTPLSVAVGGTGVTQYKYALVAAGSCTGVTYGNWTPVSSPISDSPTDNNYILCVLGKNSAGNEQTNPTSYAFEFDSLPPTVSLTGTPSAYSNVTPVVMTVGGSDVVLYQYTFEDGQSTACSSVTWPGTWTAIATNISQALTSNSVKRICVRGKDGAGNIQTVPTTVDWDHNVAPSTAILTGAPTSESKDVNLAITVSGTDVVNYKYAILSGSTDCSSAGYGSEIAVATTIGDSIAGLSDGVVTVCVLSVNKYGTTQSALSASSASWTKDTAAPTSILSNTPAAETNVTPLAVTVGGTGVTEYEYALVTTASCTGATYGAWTPVGTAISDSLTDNNYIICVKGRDLAGNVQTTVTSFAFEFDSIPPTVSLSGTPGTYSNVTPVVIAVAGADVVQYQYTFEDGQTTACSSVTWPGTWTAISTNISQTLSSEGAKRICVRGRDGAGNVQIAPTTVDWTHDITPPTATLTNAPTTGSFKSGALDITVGGTDVDTYVYAIVASATACSSAAYGSVTPVATHITDTPSDGATRLCVKGIDAATNQQLVATEETWTQDNTLPVINSFELQDKSTSSNTASNAPTVKAVFTVTETNMDKYCASTTLSSQPASNDPCWTATQPVDVVVTNGQTVYGWVMDAAKNINSAASTDTIVMVNPCDIGNLDSPSTCVVNSNKGTQTNGDTTTWEGTGNLQFSSGAQLATNNGESITISMTGDVTVDSGVTLSFNGIINAANISVVGSLDASGKGSAGGAIGQIGTGSGAASQYCANSGWGGSYGGLSGIPNYCGAGQGTAYGTAASPIDYGSGGGASSDNRGGHGGGKLKLNSPSGTVTLSGSVKANGQDVAAFDAGSAAPGAGSGGSVWIIANTISGTGSVEAKGGIPAALGVSHGSGGGGGRVSMSIGNPFSGTVAYGGGENSSLPYTTWGAKGTYVLSIANPCNTGNLSSGTCLISSALVVPDGWTLSGANLNVDSGGSISVTYPKDAITISMTGSVAVGATGSITANLSDVTGTTLTIDGTVSADSLGERALPGVDGSGAGGGKYQGNSGGGGGYGGAGGYGNYGSSADDGPSYGTLYTANSFGSAGGGAGTSGGGTGAYRGGNGGGKIKLSLSGAITVNGTLSANGESNPASQAGGAGSGGSVSISGSALSGTGSITAKGGNAVDDGVNHPGGGGGGRIVVKTGALSSFSGYNVAGGTSSSVAGSSGTVLIDINFLCDAGSSSGTGGSACTISSTKSALTAGYYYGGSGDLVVANGGLLQSNAVESIALAFGGNVTVQSGGAIKANLTDFSATNVTVDGGGFIYADGLGYQGTESGNGNGPAGSYGTAAPGGGYGGGGGAHGGKGGNGRNNTGAGGQTTYGSVTAPVTFGAAGGSDGNASYYLGGHGGGAIKFSVTSLTNNGTISANGMSGTYSSTSTNLAPGGGAGGSIWIVATTLSGSGTISANGGNGTDQTTADGGGGGGGRIALQTASKFAGAVSVTGGSGPDNAIDGDLGSVYFQNSDNYCSGTGTLATTCTVTGKYIIENGATLTASGAVTIASGGLIGSRPTEKFTISMATGSLTVQSGAYIYANLTNLSVPDLTVDSGGFIIADGLGFQGNESGDGAGDSPGIKATGTSYGGGGGAHGGKGGKGTLGVLGGQSPYGDRTSPITFGSAGGSDGNASYFWGGNGGGAIKISVTGTLSNAGTISANGSAGFSPGGITSANLAAGGGAGGSLWIVAGTMTGSGSLSANGGDGINQTTADGGGGGGGRIALHTASKFEGAINVTGGTGTDNATSGGIGTVYFQNEDNFCSGTGTLASSCTVTGKFVLEDASTLTVGGDLIVASGGKLSTRPTESATIAITGDLTVQFGGSILGNLSSLSAANVTVDSGGTISADGLGFQGNESGDGTGDSPGIKAPTTGYGGGGGAHAGAGGNGYLVALGGQTTYGSATSPTTFGSSGGSDGNAGYYWGGHGGGKIKIVATSGTISNSGTISANGQSGTYGNTHTSLAAGGGAGGSVWLVATTISGSGSISASGGNGIDQTSADGGGGGGGRIALEYTTNTFTGTKTVAGGIGPDNATDGGLGTLCLNGGGLLCDSTLTAGLKVWLDASQGVSYDGSNNVTSWVDQSGNGNDGTPVNYGSVPGYVASDATANSKPVVHFDGNSCIQKSAFASALSLPNTVIIVAKNTSGTTYFDGVSGGRNALFYWTGNYDLFANGTELKAGTPDTNWDLITGVFNSTQSQLFVKGSLLATGDTGTDGLAGYTLACDLNGSQRMVADIAEFIVYNRQLSTSERQKVEGYLAAKYSINALPSSNQLVWLRADKGLYSDASCTTPISGTANDAIACWKDQSASGNNLTQTNSSFQPVYAPSGINSSPSVRSPDVNRYLEKTSVTNTMQELFVIAKKAATLSANEFHPFGYYPISGFGAGAYVWSDNDTDYIKLGHTGATVNSGSLLGAAGGTTPWLASAKVSDFVGSLFVNGRYVSTKSAVSLSSASSGGSLVVGRYDAGDVAEAIGYQSELTSYDRSRIETYLSQKYKTTYTTSPVLDAPGLKAWYKADAGITASNYAAQFTAANIESLSVADNSNVSTGDIDYSIAGWFYFDSVGSADQFITKWDDAGQREFALNYVSLYGGFSFGVSSDGNSYDEVAVPFTPQTGKWYFLVAWHDSVNNQIGIQLNNGTASTTASSGGSFDSTAPLCFGGYGSTCASGYNHDGRMAKVGFWKKVLTAAERTALYNSGKGLGYGGLDSGLKTNLVSYWNLDEASGTRYDSTANANNLTDNNTVTQTTGPGSSVDSWADQSGMSKTASQSTAAYRPTWIADGGSSVNNKPVLRFNSSYLISSVSTPQTVLMVGRYNSFSTSTATWFSDNVASPNSWGYFAVMDDFYSKYFMSYINSWHSSSTLRDMAPHISSFTMSGSAQNIFLDGASELSNAATPSNTGTGFVIGCLSNSSANGCYSGSERYLNGDIAELVVYGGVLTTAQRQAVECYLSSKYNITLSGVTCP